MKSDDIVSFDMNYVSSDGSPIKENQWAFLETTGGYLPLSRVFLIDGKGSGSVDISGLPSGALVKVKVGFKYWASTSEITFTVE